MIVENLNTKSSLPAYLTMNEEQELIWTYLHENALGYNQRKTSSEISDALELKSGRATNEHIRDLIRDMILKP